MTGTQSLRQPGSKAYNRQLFGFQRHVDKEWGREDGPFQRTRRDQMRDRGADSTNKLDMPLRRFLASLLRMVLFAAAAGLQSRQ